MRSESRIYVAGHRGLIGSAVVRLFSAAGFTNLILRTRESLDLTATDAVDRFFVQEKPDYVVLAAGKVGGIIENKTFPADFMNENLAIQLNTLRAAQRARVKKFVFIGSSCMYPRECRQPMPESVLLTGKPEPTSMSYAISKLAGLQMCLAYNQQYGEKRFIPIIPNSAYGPHDNFNPGSGHVLSALLHRFHEAKVNHSPVIHLWGSGTPRREFVHADDIAGACLWLLTNDVSDVELPVNVGVGSDYSIAELASLVAAAVGYEGKIEWDTSKPDGAPRKLLDSSRLRGLGWCPSVEFGEGLKGTYAWYLEHVADDRRGPSREAVK